MVQKLTIKQKNILGFLLLFSMIAVGMYIAFAQTRSLASNTLFTDGHIYELATSSKSTDIIVRYNYRIGQKLYKGQDDLYRISDGKNFHFLNNLMH